MVVDEVGFREARPVKSRRPRPLQRHQDAGDADLALHAAHDGRLTGALAGRQQAALIDGGDGGIVAAEVGGARDVAAEAVAVDRRHEHLLLQLPAE